MRVATATYPLAYPFRSYYPRLECVNRNLDLVKELDLIIFTGGSDISPYIYDENPTTCYGVDQDRDSIELGVFIEARNLGIKMLGVCRGHQLINALEGGKIIQDIKPEHGAMHELVWMQDNPIADIYPKDVNSMHHQGYDVNRIANTLSILAIEPDTGIVEVAKSRDNTILTVQFHPEFLKEKKFFDYLNEWVKEA
jgi:putative glutamine amidotransferase